ncbi:MAG: energy transducer TonB [Gammaproteobacteria bacterium]
MSTLAMALPGTTAINSTVQIAPVKQDWPSTLGAAAVSVSLHLMLFLVLIGSWQATPPPATAPVLHTRLVMLAAPPPPPAPLPAAPPQVDTHPATPPLEDANLALQRREQQRAAAEAQRRQQQQAAQREEKARQEREQQERQRQQQEQQAELARRDAERAAAEQAAAQRHAANNRDYAPLQKPTPAYPDRALDRGIEGDCTVEYTVTASGTVESPQVSGECHPLFIRPSLEAAREFRYQPRLVDGQPQAVAGVRNTFHYRIEPQP